MKDSLKMLEVSKDISDTLFLKIFDGMQGVFTYYKLIFDKGESPEDYRFILVDFGSEKQLNSIIEAGSGRKINEILPDLEKPWIDKLNAFILQSETNQLTCFNANTKRFLHVNSFSKDENKFITIIDDVKKVRGSIEELTFQNKEKEKRAAELIVANKELAFQNHEKERLANELTLLIDTANAPIFGINAEGKVNEWNQKSAEITGFKKEEVLGKDLVETYITENYRDAVKQVLDNALKGKETANYEFPLFTKDDKRVMVLLNSSTRRNGKGEIVGVLGVGQDISEMDKLRTESESVAKELRQFIETANAPIFGIDSKGLVNEWNQTAEKITGFKKEEVLGKDLVETYITEDYRDSVKQVLDDALKGKETANYEFPLFTKDDKRVMVLLNSSTRRNVEGEIVGVLGVGQDISEIDKLRTESESVAMELRQFIETANAPIF
ncbi:MAG: PAS domain S-box-containing protein, partial [Flavobacteriaceae bacterium]